MLIKKEEEANILILDKFKKFEKIFDEE